MIALREAGHDRRRVRPGRPRTVSSSSRPGSRPSPSGSYAYGVFLMLARSYYTLGDSRTPADRRAGHRVSGRDLAMGDRRVVHERRGTGGGARHRPHDRLLGRCRRPRRRARSPHRPFVRAPCTLAADRAVVPIGGAGWWVAAAIDPSGRLANARARARRAWSSAERSISLGLRLHRRVECRRNRRRRTVDGPGARQRRGRCVRRRFVGAAALVGVATLAVPRPPRARPRAPRRAAEATTPGADRVLVLSLPVVTWEDMNTRTALPNLTRLLDRSAIGGLTTRTIDRHPRPRRRLRDARRGHTLGRTEHVDRRRGLRGRRAVRRHDRRAGLRAPNRARRSTAAS